jgi:hypothetical protein
MKKPDIKPGEFVYILESQMWVEVVRNYNGGIVFTQKINSDEVTLTVPWDYFLTKEEVLKASEAIAALQLDAEKQKLSQRLEECENALRFYAEVNNWRGTPDQCGAVVANELIGDKSYPSQEAFDDCFEASGKRAREYFKKYEGEK